MLVVYSIKRYKNNLQCIQKLFMNTRTDANISHIRVFLPLGISSVSFILVSPGFLSCPVVRAKVYGKRERKESFSALTFNEVRKGPFLAELRRPGLGWWCIATCPCGRNPWGTPYNSICGEAPHERGTFFRFLIHERVGISLVEVYERAAKSVFSVCKKTKTPNKCILCLWKGR